MILLVQSLSACDGADPRVIDVAISGTLQYEDRNYDAQGFTGELSRKAIRYASVELLDGNTPIAATQSDASGNYRLQGQGVRLRVRVLAQSDAGVGSPVTVANYAGDVYAVSRGINLDGESQLDFLVPASQNISGAFNILDVLSSAKQFIADYDANFSERLTAHWQPGVSDYGTYYCSVRTGRKLCPGGSGIYLIGGHNSGGDTDQFDDDVILHEFGHFLEDKLGIQDSPGGTHYLSDTDSDIRLAWSEGWGGFIPGAVKTWMKQKHPELLSASAALPASYFVDSYGQYAMISMDLGDPSGYYCWSGGNCYNYSTSEVAVANVLNGVNQNYGFAAVWSAVSTYMPYSTPYSASLETFWDGWVAQRDPDSAELSQLYTILARSAIYYRADSYENDDNVVLAKPYAICSNCNLQRRYLYRSSGSLDVDYAYIDLVAGTQYDIKTEDLANAADTYIRVLTQDGAQAYSADGRLMANDNRPGTVFCYPLESPCKIHNDETMLSSQLLFTPTVSATYIVEISTSSSRPSAAGRYGSYSLSVQALP